MSYTAIEAGLLTVITDNMSDFDTDNTKAGDEDDAFAHILGSGETQCCILDYSGFRRDRSSSFLSQHVIWAIRVTFYVVYDKDTIEATIRGTVDDFSPLVAQNHRLGDTTPGATLAAGDAFQSIRRGDRTFIPIVFLVEALEQLG